MSVEAAGMKEGIDLDGDLGWGGPLPRLSATGLETLLASLDPRLDGFGEGPSCLDDALAYLNRLASSTGDGDSGKTEIETAAMVQWIEIWRGAGGNRPTLRLMVQTVLAERLRKEET
jgi:hypothetical protein